MSFTKTKYDNCAMNQTNKTNKSIFDYVVNPYPHISEQECNDFTPPFLAYIPTGVQPRNIDMENDLKGITRPVTKCNACKYTPDPKGVDGQYLNSYPNNKQECSHSIIENGYLRKM